MNIPIAILASAAVIGLLADLMLKENFHTNTMVGFGIPVVTTTLALATCLLACASKIPSRRRGLGFLIPAVVFSLAFLLRDSPTLLFIDLGVIVSALAFASYSLMGTPLARGGLTHYASALLSIAITPTFNTIELLVREINWNEMMSETSARHVAAVIKGLAIATPLVGIFLGLFLAADPAFAAIAQKTFQFDLGDLSVNMIIFSLFAWLSAGFLHGLSIFRYDGSTNLAAFDEQDDLSSAMLTASARPQKSLVFAGGVPTGVQAGVVPIGVPNGVVPTGVQAKAPVLDDGFEYAEFEDGVRFSQLGIAERKAVLHSSRLNMDVAEKKPMFALGATEMATVIGSVNVLFAGFVAVQLRYLFGGASLIELTPGLSYAEYVHKGFFELNTVVALVLPMLLMADSMLIRKTKMGELVFRVLSGTQIALVLVILGSALLRMNLYQAEYGQSELRLYVTVFMGWVGSVCAIFAGTVLSGRREKFAFASYISGVAIMLGINLANPDALIQSTNIALSKLRPQDVGLVLNEAPKPFDAEYAISLSADAVPALVESIGSLPKSKARIAAKALLEGGVGRLPNLEEKQPGDWRLFNLSRKLAFKAIRSHKNQLTVIANSTGDDE